MRNSAEVMKPPLHESPRAKVNRLCTEQILQTTDENAVRYRAVRHSSLHSLTLIRRDVHLSTSSLYPFFLKIVLNRLTMRT